MAEPPTNKDESNGPPDTPAPTPANYQRTESKERFAVAKFYGMGSDGEWEVSEIADALDVSKRQVYRYIHESEIGDEVREVLATTEAEWRLDLALQLRQEVDRLESLETDLLKRKQAIPTDYEKKTVHGTPTGDRNISLADHQNDYKLTIPVPTNFETVTDYGTDLERIQKEKRQYLAQIAKLLGLNSADRTEIDETLTQRHEEVKIIEFRESDDDYPDAEVIDVDGESAEFRDANGEPSEGPANSDDDDDDSVDADDPRRP